MELNKHETTLTSLVKTYEHSCEQSIDTEITLADYCPEVNKVLKCIAEPNALSTQCTENGISVGGQLAMTVIYLDPEGKLNSVNHICPFTKTFETADANGCYAEAVPMVNYLNTKAVGPRKLEMHGSIGISVTVLDIKRKSVITELQGEGIHSKNDCCSVVRALPPIEKSIFVDDDLQIPQNRPSIGRLIRADAKATVDECKYVSGKVVVKGDFTLELLYCPSPEGRPILLTETRGFSQVVDCAGESEDLLFDSFIKVQALDVRTKTSMDGEVRNVSFEAKMCLTVFPYEQDEICRVTDAFSTVFKADIIKERIKLQQFGQSICENFVCKKTVDPIGLTVTDIYDIWCCPKVEHWGVENGEAVVRGTVTLNVLCSEDNDSKAYFEKELDFEFSTLISADDAVFKPEVTVKAVNFSLNAENRVDVSVELNAKFNVFLQSEEEAIVSAVISEEAVSKDHDTAAVLYFAENESVWCVAKKYKTSPLKVCAVNGIDDADEPQNKMLLVPSN